MNLERLMKEIEEKIVNRKTIIGKVKYLGCNYNRGTDKTLSFQYSFKEGSAKEYLIYDSDENSTDVENVETAAKILYNYIGANAIIKISNIKNNLAKIQIYLEDNSYDLEQEEIVQSTNRSESSLDFYLKSEADGLSAEESGFPDYYDEGRAIWLKKH